MRVDDHLYQMIKTAADGERRNLSNFIEFATLQYLSSAAYVTDREMAEILSDHDLVANLKTGLKDIEKGEFSLV